MRARRATFGGSSLLLCAALAFVFVTPYESRNQGGSPSPALEVTPAQAMSPAPRRSVSLPIDRVMTAPVEILGGHMAADVWSTPLQAEEAAVHDPEPLAADLELRQESAQSPNVLFEHASLFDQTVPIEGSGGAVVGPSGTTAPAPAPLSLRSLAGRWAPDRAACSDRNKRTAFLPLTIDQRGAKAGAASCTFRRTDQQGNRWLVAATCTDASETWSANVRLVLAGDKLTWSSERGTQTYSRCR